MVAAVARYQPGGEVISDPLLARMKRGGTTVGDVAALADVFAGLSPICRAKYISRCCDGPVDVYHGEMQGTTDKWAVPIIRRCCLCGLQCEGYYPPGRDPRVVATTNPEGV
jgi:hypothetical protein